MRRSQRVSLASASAGKPVLAPTKRTLAFESGSAALGKRTGDGSPVADMHFQDKANGKTFAVNVFVGSDLNCPANRVEREMRSPRGRAVCFVTLLGDGVDIRYVHSGIGYVFSFADPKGNAPSAPSSDVGRWALSVVDSYE